MPVKTSSAAGCRRGDFANSDAIGPSRAAEFLYGRPDAAIQADDAGFVRQLLAECRK